MGQAKNRKAEIDQLKQTKKGVIVIVPLDDQTLYKGGTPGDYIKENLVPNAMIVGTCVSSIAGVIKTLIMITTDVPESQARSAMEQWWKFPQNAGTKLAVWLPLNDMKQMTVSGLEKFGPEVQGQSVGMLVNTAGVVDLVNAGLKSMCEKDPTYVNAFNALGDNWGDKIVA